MPSPIPSTTSVANWNRATQHVEAQIRSGRYVNAETALIVAGPPRISDLAGASLSPNLSTDIDAAAGAAGSAGADGLYPIGLVEQFGVQQVQAVQKMFEIGSRRSYQAGGRVQVGGSIGRVMFNGPSLMRALYAYYPSTVRMANGGVLRKDDSVGSRMVNLGGDSNLAFPQIYFEPGSFAAPDPETQGKNSSKNNAFFINLMSELFSHPFGLGVILRDNNNRNYGALYLEDCFLTAHSWQISSSSTLITEACNFQADAAIPLEFSTGLANLTLV